jgi:hypothetical protein
VFERRFSVRASAISKTSFLFAACLLSSETPRQGALSRLGALLIAHRLPRTDL